MKSAGGTELYEILIELKYCERCGGLWLRPQGSTTVYCAGCKALLDARQNLIMTSPFRSQRRKSRGRRTGKRGDALRASSRCDCLECVATIEVRA
jgi:hypothetical protein